MVSTTDWGFSHRLFHRKVYIYWGRVFVYYYPSWKLAFSLSLSSWTVPMCLAVRILFVWSVAVEASDLPVNCTDCLSGRPTMVSPSSWFYWLFWELGYSPGWVFPRLCSKPSRFNFDPCGVRNQLAWQFWRWGFSWACFWAVMEAQSRSEDLGSWCRQALHCLHRLLWDCLWPSRGSFHFSWALTLVSWNGEGVFNILVELGISAFFTINWVVHVM